MADERKLQFVVADALKVLPGARRTGYRAWFMLNGANLGHNPIDEIAVGEKVLAQARINHGRWLCDCPDPDCGGSELVTMQDPVFFCLSCGNVKWGGKFLQVDFPGKKLLKAILTHLSKRPKVINRNWYPHEEPADLIAENIAAGLGRGR